MVSFITIDATRRPCGSHLENTMRTPQLHVWSIACVLAIGMLGTIAHGQAEPAGAGSAVLDDFESPKELALFAGDAGAQVDIGEEYSTSGGKCMKVTFPAGADIAGPLMEAPPITDWSPYATFKVDVYNPQDTPIRITQKFKGGGKAISEQFTIPSKEPHTITVAIADLAGTIDVKKITYLKYFPGDVTNSGKAFTLYFDNMRLQKAGAGNAAPAAGASAVAASASEEKWDSADPRWQQSSDGKYRIKFESSLNKIFEDAARNRFSQQPLAKFQLELAKNEYEPFQVVLQAKSDLKNAHVENADLANTNDARPIIARTNITINPVGYVDLKKPYYTGVYEPKGIGRWPDPLLEESSVDVKAGQFQPFWVEVHAPKDTQSGTFYLNGAGMYRVKLTVSADGAAPTTLEVPVKVWDFAISDESHLPTTFELFPRYLRAEHKLEKGSPEDFAMLEKYYEDMLAHRMSPTENLTDIPDNRPVLLGIKDGVATYDFTGFDKAVEYYLSLHQNTFALAMDAEKGKDYVVACSRALGKHLEEKGWLKLFFTWMVDESYRGEEQRAWVHEGYPGIRNMLTIHGMPDPKYPNVDIWCPQIVDGFGAFPEKMDWARKNKILWMYTSGNAESFYPCMNTDLPAMATRITPWFCWKFDSPGFLYWQVNNWPDGSPWTHPMTFSKQNGNGSMYYPGTTGPVHSTRLETFRDGMEDYEYFYMLRDLAGKATGTQKDQALAALTAAQWNLSDRGFADLYNKDRTGETMLSVRSKMGEALEQLQKSAGK